MQPDLTKFQLNSTVGLPSATQPTKQVNQLSGLNNFVNNALGSFGQGLLNTKGAIGGLFSKPATGFVSGNSGIANSSPTGAPAFSIPASSPVTAPQPTITQTTKTVSSPSTLSTPPVQDLAVQGGLPSQSTQSLPSYNPNPPLPTPSTFGQSPITQDGYVPSSAMASNSTYQDVINKRAQLEKQYQQSLMSAVDIQNQGLQNIENARYSGETQGFANGMTERAQRNADLASLAATNRAGAFGKLLEVSQQDVTNALNAQPNNIGSNVNQATGDVYISRRNPTTGQVETTLAGNIGQQKQYTSTSVNQDPMTGNLIFTGVRQDGTIENQILGGGQSGAGVQTVSQGGVPFQLQGSTATAPNGQMYVNQDKLTPGLERAQTIAAKNAGIPVLSQSEVQTVRDVEYVKSSIEKVQDTISTILSPGLEGRVKGLTVNPIKEFLQSDTQIATFQVYRDAAIKIIQSLAGGTGSGLRLNQAEINTAITNIPTINDNYETAAKKLQLVNSLLDSKVDTLFPNSPKTGGGTGGQTIVQTKAGAINTNW